MIAGIFHKGSGLGNQIHRYVMTRVLARDNGWKFGMLHPEDFKGSSFLNIDMGEKVTDTSTFNHFVEKKVLHKNGSDIRGYDWDGIRSIKDYTVIDGEFQGEEYFIHRKQEIRSWLQINTLPFENNICIINFRGGEYTGNAELFLPPSYWNNAIAHMRSLDNNMVFRVVTDDVDSAKKFFPEFEISHNLENDYAAIQSAPYLILSNSSFAFFPAWLNENSKRTIAPKYWARHNISDGYWSCGYNIVKGWLYQDRAGILHDYFACISALEQYNTNSIRDTLPKVVPPLSLRSKLLHIIPKGIKTMIKKIIYD